KPTQQFEPSIRRHRRAVLDEGEFLRAAPSSSAGQPVDIFDGASGRQDDQGTVLAPGPIRQARGQRVILASRRARENRRVQIAIIVSDTKRGSSCCDHRSRDQEKRSADKSLAAPGATETCHRISWLLG